MMAAELAMLNIKRVMIFDIDNYADLFSEKDQIGGVSCPINMSHAFVISFDDLVWGM